MKKTTDFLIVEDELIIAEVIFDILNNAGYTSVRMVESFDEAIAEIDKRKPQIVLSDINLGKGKTGIDLGNLLNTKYRIPFIYITSYFSPEILAKAKHTRPEAYLVKPFKDPDLLAAIELAVFGLEEESTSKEESEILLKVGRVMVRLNTDEITWIESDDNYSTINLKSRERKVVRMSLSELHGKLSPTDFIRVHKSFLVNKKCVTELRSGNVMLSSVEIPVGRTYQQQITDLFK